MRSASLSADLRPAVLQTLGYHAAGDLGGASYRQAPVQAEGPGRIQSADGTWWELAELAPDVRMFGARGDGTGDDTAAIQAAIDFAISRQLSGAGPLTIFLSGRHKITAPLLGFSYKGPSFQVCSFSLRGRARGYQAGRRIELLPTFKDAPAIILQKVRAVVLDDFAITGTANKGGNPSYGQLIDDTTSPWWNTGGARDSGYSPQCGVAIDPFGSGLPPDGGYPRLNGKGGPNYYTDHNSGSSGVTIGEGMCISGHIVGVALALSSNTQLGDNMKICGNLSGNKVCIAMGQSQSRGVTIERPFVLGCQVFIDCNRYGNGTAQVPNVLGGVLGYVKWLILSKTGGYGNGSITNLYSESIYSLGVYIGPGPLDFFACEFKFLFTDAARTGIGDVILCNGGPVNFLGGQLINYSGHAQALSFLAQGKLAFKGTTFNSVPNVSDWSYVSAEDCFLKYEGGHYGWSRQIDADPAVAAASNARTVLAPGGKLVTGGGPARQTWMELGGVFQVEMEADVALTNRGDGTAAFTSSNGGLYQLAMALSTPAPWRPWPELAESGVEPPATASLLIGQVAGVAGDLVTLTDVPRNLPSGRYTICLNRLGSLRRRTVGSTTAGSPKVTGVTPHDTFRAGDFVHSAQLSGIPQGTHVVSNERGTMILSRKATVTRANLDIQDAEYRLVCRGASPPSHGVYFCGDVCENTSPSSEANGMTVAAWICVEAGSPGTWKPSYASHGL